MANLEEYLHFLKIVSILVAAQAAQKIPVSCVEQGRWRHVADKFTASREFSYANLRRQKAAQVEESLRTRGDFSADQSAIWAEVERKHWPGTVFSSN